MVSWYVLTLASPGEVTCHLLALCPNTKRITVNSRLTVIVANAGVQVDLSIDVLAVLTGNTASEDVTIVDPDARDLAGVVEVRHDEFGKSIT